MRAAPVVAARRNPGGSPECGREGARLAETQPQADIRNRECVRRQQGFRLLDAPVRVVSMRGHTKGLLERAAEVVCAQLRHVRQGVERYVLGQMLLDVRGDEPSLPGRQPSFDRSVAAAAATVQPHQLVHEHYTERFEVTQALGLAALKETRQL